MPPEGGFIVADLDTVSTRARATPTAIIYLTFDDGPLYGTDDVLDVLTDLSLHGQVTFLDVGKHIDTLQFSFRNSWRGKNKWTGAEMVELTRDLGNLVANHSYTHASGTTYQEFYSNAETVLADFNQCAATITGILGPGGTGFDVKLGRLPGRNTWRTSGVNRTDGDSATAANLLSANGYSLFGWDLEYSKVAHSESARSQLIAAIASRASGKASPRTPGKIVLLFHDQNHRHSQGGREPLRLFLQSLKDADYKFSTLSGY